MDSKTHVVFSATGFLNRDVELTQKEGGFSLSGIGRCTVGWVVTDVWRETCCFRNV